MWFSDKVWAFCVKVLGLVPGTITPKGILYPSSCYTLQKETSRKLKSKLNVRS